MHNPTNLQEILSSVDHKYIHRGYTAEVSNLNPSPLSWTTQQLFTWRENHKRFVTKTIIVLFVSRRNTTALLLLIKQITTLTLWLGKVLLTPELIKPFQIMFNTCTSAVHCSSGIPSLCWCPSESSETKATP